MHRPIRASSPAAVPTFQRIKDYVLQQIQSGTWQEGDAIPSEAALAKQFEVARMTVNRALRELSDERTLTRVRGSGTFVAQQKYQSTLVQLRNIADEIAARGHVHRGELQKLERCRADAALARQFELSAAQTLFHSVVVHFENDVPIQVEDRYVNPAVAPDYLAQDFRQPDAQRLPDARGAAAGRAVLHRRPACPAPMWRTCCAWTPASPAWCCAAARDRRAMVASVSALWHPASRYRFTGSF
ncbi:GntR family transcriptional regulator [Alicycliphilus sp. B1]|nr:GntR family transcriptional regulator [Alicycliphilus sp. B1]